MSATNQTLPKKDYWGATLILGASPEYSLSTLGEAVNWRYINNCKQHLMAMMASEAEDHHHTEKSSIWNLLECFLELDQKSKFKHYLHDIGLSHSIRPGQVGSLCWEFEVQVIQELPHKRLIWAALRLSSGWGIRSLILSPLILRTLSCQWWLLWWRSRAILCEKVMGGDSNCR